MQSSRRRELPARFLRDLQAFLALNRPLEDVNKASFLVRYFIKAVEGGAQPEARVIDYVARAISRAQKSHDLDKELGIKRPRRGNPGGQPKKRLLTPGDHEEIPLRFSELLGTKSRRQVARELAAEYHVTERTIIDLAGAFSMQQRLDALTAFSSSEGDEGGAAPAKEGCAGVPSVEDQKFLKLSGDPIQLLSMLKAWRGKGSSRLRSIMRNI